MGLIAEIHKDLDRSALQLMAEYHGRLRVEAVRLCADDAEAEDLVFRTLERVVAKADTYKDDLNLFAWMKSIMESIHKNDRRRPVVRGTTAVESDKLEEYAGADWSTDEEILRNSDCEVLREVLQRIDPKERDILLMRYYDGFSLKEIANVLNMPVSTVGRRIHLAMRLLAGKLGTKLGKAKKPLAVLGAILLSAGTLFGAYQVGLVDAIKAAVAGVEKVEKSEPSASLSAPVSQGGAAVPAAQKEKAISNEAIAKSGRDGVPSPSAFPSARLEAEPSVVTAVESISANEQEGTNEMKEVQVVKALAGAASAVTLAAAPLLAVAEEESKPYDAIVDYVQSTGTQCVDTGIVLGPTHTVVLKFARVEGSAVAQNIFGYSTYRTGSMFNVVFTDAGNNEQRLQILRSDYGCERIRLNLGRASTEDRELKVGPDEFRLDGISMTSGNLMTITRSCSGKAYIFGVGYDGASSGYVCGVVRVKACQIYDGADLVRDFRPVRKDGEGRLYDCVSKTLYATKGKGALATGPDSAEQEFGELKFTKNVINKNRRLKYIEATGVQAASVDAKEGATTETKIKFSFPAPLPTTITGIRYLYGYSTSGKGSDDRGFAVGREKNDSQERLYLYRRESSAKRTEFRTPYAAHDPKEHFVVMRKGAFTLDGVDYGPMADLTGDCYLSGCLFSIFYNNRRSYGDGWYIESGAFHDGTKDIAGCPARLYSFTMKRDGKQVRNLVPMQTAIGVGLWDTVANRFHPCISYSGDFIAGPPAPGLALILY